jgi:hypothetical protein
METNEPVIMVKLSQIQSLKPFANFTFHEPCLISLPLLYLLTSQYYEMPNMCLCCHPSFLSECGEVGI